MASASFVGLRGATGATVLVTIVFLALDEGLDVSWRDRPNVMAQLADLARPEVSAATRFHRDNARRQLPEKPQHLRSPQFLFQNRTACTVRSVDLKYILCQIESDRDNL